MGAGLKDGSTNDNNSNRNNLLHPGADPHEDRRGLGFHQTPLTNHLPTTHTDAEGRQHTCGPQESKGALHGHGGEDSLLRFSELPPAAVHRPTTPDSSPRDYPGLQPALWCNWTIQVDPGKRIHLHLEDLTDDAWPPSRDLSSMWMRLHNAKVLLKCWREAALPRPTPPVQGAVDRWLARAALTGASTAATKRFGPPVVYNHRSWDPVMDGE
ncbi:uncharacterized protein AKAME5_001947000 [Lates japonicus]|uniref:CUB domain-containing protein n=1 Tax=Lates japonicus TaxID=270547 RepID=A0AAD3N5I8_LATJO|nr:uncharacterized protein AKAME5_001947000 [Lates japonicus]